MEMQRILDLILITIVALQLTESRILMGKNSKIGQSKCSTTNETCIESSLCIGFSGDDVREQSRTCGRNGNKICCRRENVISRSEELNKMKCGVWSNSTLKKKLVSVEYYNPKTWAFDASIAKRIGFALFWNSFDCAQEEEFSALKRQPWLATIFHLNEDDTEQILCTGSLIYSNYILTSASCIVNAMELNKNNLWARLGEWKKGLSPDSGNEVAQEETTEVRILDTSLHPIYWQNKNKSNATLAILGHDIAILKLERHVEYASTISPICLPFFPPNTKEFVASGLKTNKDFRSPRIVLEEQVKVEEDHCKKWYPNSNLTYSVCTTQSVGESECIDYAGPLVGTENKRSVIFGVASHTPSCLAKNLKKPMLYADIYESMTFITFAVDLPNCDTN